MPATKSRHVRRQDLPRNGEACHSELLGEIGSDEQCDEDLHDGKKKSREFTLFQQSLTGKNSKSQDGIEDIERELFRVKLARD